MKIPCPGWKRFGPALLALGLATAAGAQETAVEAALAALRTTLAQEPQWIKVHAAEVLAAQGEGAAVHAVFLQELAAHGTESGYRQGIRRTLALTSATPAERAAWIEPIAATVVDPAAPDRLYAIESLCKLGPPHAPAVQAAVAKWLATAPVEEAVYLHWLQGQAGDPSGWTAIAAQLESPVPYARLRAAFILRRTGFADAAALAALARAADAEPAGSTVRAIIVGAAYRLRAAPGRLAAWRAVLDQLVADGTPGDRYEALQSLRPLYQPADLPGLQALLRHPHGDVRTAAAWAILTVSGRSP